jgi:uncharacterized protein
MGVFFTAAALGLACFLLCVPALGAPERRRYALWGVLFVILLTTSTDLRRVFPIIPRIPGHYNWTGKLLELLIRLFAMAILVRFGGWSRQELGLRLGFNTGAGRDIVRFLLPVLLVEIAVLWLLIPGQTPSFEDHLFQLTAPGITEELAFRGVLLGLLDRAFPRRVCFVGAELGWSAVVSSLLFGLWHGLDVDAHFRVSLELAPMMIPTVGGFVLAWCRSRSGSLILPILAHSGMNEMANIIALVKTKAA